MSLKSSTPKASLRRIAFTAVVIVLTNGSFIRAQRANTPEPKSFSLPDEATGIDGVVQTLISVFDQADIVGLGEAHNRKADSDLRIALVRHPDFAEKVRSIVVEFGSTTEQETLDRYIRGENVSRAQLEQIWKTTSNGVWDSPSTSTFSRRYVTSIRD